MKKISESESYGFWSYAFQVSSDDLKSGSFHTSSKGFYIERNLDVIYLFDNLITGSKFLIANQENVDYITKLLSSKNINSRSILDLDKFDNYNLEFDDIDLFLNKRPLIELNESNLKKISKNDKDLIELFYKDLSRDDIDTLDLDFEEKTTMAFAVYSDDAIAAIGRYYIIPTEKGTMDITLVTSEKYRGRGFASLLLKKMISLGLENNLVPRYRVKTDNIASIKVAEKLSFEKYCQIQALYPKKISNLKKQRGAINGIKRNSY